MGIWDTILLVKWCTYMEYFVNASQFIGSNVPSKSLDLRGQGPNKDLAKHGIGPRNDRHLRVSPTYGGFIFRTV